MSQDSVDIDNLTQYSSPGSTAMTWDGNDDSGNPVGSDTYTLALFANDDSGLQSGTDINCESNCVTVPVTVTDSSASATTLIWPTDVDDGDSGDSLGVTPDGIPGYTDASTVSYTQDPGQPDATSGSVQSDSAGYFFIPVSQSYGLHTMALSCQNGSLSAAGASLPYFLNDLEITSPQSYAVFDPQVTGGISVSFTSECADTVNAYVTNPYDQSNLLVHSDGSVCISTQQPVPSADLLNGVVSETTVVTLSTGQPVSTILNTVQWDGNDSSGNPVPPGVYNIVIQRSNTDGLLDIQAVVAVIIQRQSGSPQIVACNAVAIGPDVTVNWITDVATNGYVAYDMGGVPVGKVSVAGAATAQSVLLPATCPDTVYDYYVVAINPTTGAAAISARQSVTSGDGLQMGKIASLVTSSTTAQVNYFGTDSCAAEIEYAPVGPSVTSMNWQRLEDTTLKFRAQFRAFQLTGECRICLSRYNCSRQHVG